MTSTDPIQAGHRDAARELLLAQMLITVPSGSHCVCASANLSDIVHKHYALKLRFGIFQAQWPNKLLLGDAELDRRVPDREVVDVVIAQRLGYHRHHLMVKSVMLAPAESKRDARFPEFGPKGRVFATVLLHHVYSAFAHLEGKTI